MSIHYVDAPVRTNWTSLELHSNFPLMRQWRATLVVTVNGFHVISEWVWHEGEQQARCSAMNVTDNVADEMLKCFVCLPAHTEMCRAHGAFAWKDLHVFSNMWESSCRVKRFEILMLKRPLSFRAFKPTLTLRVPLAFLTSSGTLGVVSLYSWSSSSSSIAGTQVRHLHLWHQLAHQLNFASHENIWLSWMNERCLLSHNVWEIRIETERLCLLFSWSTSVFTSFLSTCLLLTVARLFDPPSVQFTCKFPLCLVTDFHEM